MEDAKSLGIWPRLQKGIEWAVIFAFLVALVLPLADMYFGIDTSAPLSEKRRLAAFPPFSKNLEVIKEYPGHFDAWFKDQFGFRNLLVRANSLARVHLLGVSPNEDVIVGRKDWLFLAGDRAMLSYRATNPLADDILARWKAALETARAYGERSGAKFLFVMIPQKHMIYGENLPYWLRRSHAQGPTEQLIDYLKAHSTIDVLYPLDYLMEHKEEPLYYSRDSHWSAYGSFRAYERIMHTLGEQFDGLAPLPMSDFHKVTRERSTDLMGMLGNAILGLETSDVLVRNPLWKARYVNASYFRDVAGLGRHSRATVCASGAPIKAAVFHDSFGWAIRPYLAEHFERAVFIGSNWARLEMTKVLDQEKPDLVLFLISERRVSDEGALLTIENAFKGK